MAMVALLVFSVVGFISAVVGFFAMGMSFGGAFALYLGLSILGPACVVPVAHALSNVLGLNEHETASA